MGSTHTLPVHDAQSQTARFSGSGRGAYSKASLYQFYEYWGEEFQNVFFHKSRALEFLHLKLASCQAEVRTSTVPKLVILMV